jgi:3-phosphoshikimate 1-carboxyvinyltransferase
VPHRPSAGGQLAGGRSRIRAACPKMARLILPAPQPRRAELSVPGDKSLTHRALLLAAVADGVTEISNPNRGGDVDATMRALRMLGVRMRHTADGVRVRGTQSFVSPNATIDCGNSGTTMRLVAGLAAGLVDATLDGDESLRRRPMERVARPLRAMGARVLTGPHGRPPVTLVGRSELQGRRFFLHLPSAQVKSAILLAGLRARGGTVVTERLPSRDHTERMLALFGASIRRRGRTVWLSPGRLQSPGRICIPGDTSAALTMACLGAAVPGSSLKLRDVCLNPTRTGALHVLERMGVRIRIHHPRLHAGETRGDLWVRGVAGPLRAASVGPAAVPSLIDEIPVLCALAAAAQGTFVIRGAADLRHKETDRIATTVALLRSFGADAAPLRDGIRVKGGKALSPPRSVATRGDHRIGLAAAVLAAVARAPVRIEDSACIATSFPDFEQAWHAAFGP